MCIRDSSEAEPFWTEFLRSLNRRGLRGVKLVISDSHEGIKAAAAKVLKATWQRCRVHFMRNALAHAGKTQRRMVSAAIGTVFVQDTAEAARAQWRSVADQLRSKFPKLGKLCLLYTSRVLVQAKVGVNEPPQLDRHRYYTVSETAIVKMAAPQTVIMLGAMLGGLVSVFLFPQSRPKSVILAYRQGGFAPALESTFGLLYSVAGACLLSAIVTVMLARLSESQFLVKISVNDFWGAVVVGFIAQYAGVSILDKLVPGRAKARQEETGAQGGAETKTKSDAPTPAGDKDEDAKP